MFATLNKKHKNFPNAAFYVRSHSVQCCRSLPPQSTSERSEHVKNIGSWLDWTDASSKNFDSWTKFLILLTRLHFSNDFVLMKSWQCESRFRCFLIWTRSISSRGVIVCPAEAEPVGKERVLVGHQLFWHDFEFVYTNLVTQ